MTGARGFRGFFSSSFSCPDVEKRNGGLVLDFCLVWFELTRWSMARLFATLFLLL